MTIKKPARAELKAQCLALLDNTAIEHPAGHQGKLAARYILRSNNQERIGLMFEKGDNCPAYLWVNAGYAAAMLDTDIISLLYPASALYQTDEATKKTLYGRHAALKPMRDLANADLVRFNIDRIIQFEQIIDHLRLQ
jgi:hypothetical protein